MTGPLRNGLTSIRILINTACNDMGKRSRPQKSDSIHSESAEAGTPDSSPQPPRVHRQEAPPRPDLPKSRSENARPMPAPSQEVSETREPVASNSTREHGGRRRGRFLRRLSMAAASVGALLAFAPALVSLQPVRDYALSRATSGAPVRVNLQDISLAWWNPVRVSGIEIVDDQAQVLARVQEIRSERTLGQLIMDWTRLGTWTVEGAEVDVALRPDGSNWEDLLAKWPVSSDSGSPVQPTGQITILHGVVRMYRQGDPTTAKIQTVEADVVLTGDLTKGIELKAITREAGSRDTSGSSGTMAVETRVIPASNTEEATRTDVKVTWETFPIHTLQPLAYRFGHDLQLAGDANGSLATQIDLGSSTRVQPLDVTLQIQQFAAQSPLWQNEPIASRSADLAMQLSLIDTQLQITKGHLRTDWADIQCQGTVLTDQLTNVLDGSLAAFGQDVVTQGRVNLASLAQQLPRTLALREGLEWRSGDLEWSVQQAAAEQGTKWQGRIAASNLAAEHSGQLMKWTDPLSAQFVVAQVGDDWSVEDARLESSFVTARGQGRRQDGQIQFRADLARLSQELGQFVEFGEQTLAGRLTSDVQWSTEDETGWKATARVSAEQFQWRDGAQVLWQEQKLLANASAFATIVGGKIEEVRSGSVQLQADADRLDATLQSPVRVTDWQSDLWPIEAKIGGGLANWQNRLRPFVDTAGWETAGDLTAQATLRVSPAVLELDQSQLQIRNLQVTDGERRWQEPAIQAQAKARVDLARQRFDCQRLTLASTSLSMRADQVTWPPTEGQQQAVVQFRGDMARLWQHAMPLATSRPQGQLSGKLQLNPTATDVQVSGTTNVQGFQWETWTPSRQPGVPPQTVVLWQEPAIDVRVNGSWQAADQTLRLQQFQLQSQAATVNVEGQISQWDGPMMSDLRGTTSVDLEQLSARLRPLYGDQIRLTGSVDRPFFTRGPLVAAATESMRTDTRMVSQGTEKSVSWVSPALEAKAGLGWQTAHAFGFDLGAAAVDATLAKQTVQIEPMDLEVSGGKLHLAPQIRMQDPPTLTLPAGRVIEQVRITPAMCQSWLKYMAPLVADATAAEGQFSADVRQASVPLLDPTRAELDALVSIHTARIGPGPIAQEILSVVQQARMVLDPQRGASRFLAKDAAWVSFPEQQVSCRMNEGRVYHQNLTMMIGETTVRTEGWVGLDQQISLVAEIPVQDDWVADRRWLEGLRGQSLRIPIQGTMQRPQLDRSILQQLGGQAVRGAAEGLLKDEVQKQLNKFLPELLPQ